MSKNRYEALDGVRGLAVILVLVGHIMDTLCLGKGFYHTIADASAKTGMTLFFVLSGSVMYFGYGDISAITWRTALRFFGARFARLYPLYVVTLLLYGSIGVLRYKPIIAASYLTLTQSWFNTQLYTYAPAWSISTEWFFYAFFFVVMLPIMNWVTKTKSGFLSSIRQFPGMTAMLWAAAVLIGAGIHGVIFLNLSQMTPWLSALLENPANVNVIGWLQYFSPYVRLLEFILGVVTAIYITSDVKSGISIYFILGGAILFFGIVMLMSTRNHSFGSYVLCNFLSAPILSVFIILSVRTAFVRRIFTSQLLMFTGKISYSIYLLQFAIMTLLNTLIPQMDLISILIKGICVALFTYCVAYGSYSIIERPAQVAIRGVISKLIAKRRVPPSEQSILGQAESM